MKVTISVPGRFHAFDMAKQLQGASCLEQLITSYPASKAATFGINKSLVRSIISKEIIYRFLQKVSRRNADFVFVNNWFDAIAARKINLHSDIYVIWSGFGLKTIKRIRRKYPRAKIIIERGSTHIEFQRDILAYAYKSFPELRPTLPSRGVIEKELREYEAADYIAVPTRYVQKTFIDRNIPASKLIVTPYGVNLSAFTLKSFKPANKLEIIFAGNFCVRKGARTIISVMDAQKNNPHFHFTIVGSLEEGMMSHIKTFIDNGKLTYIPPVAQAELTTWYHKADIFLFPSFEEGMAMVLLQAMACGLCVITTPNSGAEMLVQDNGNGFLTEPEDVQKINDLLALLHASPGRLAELGNKARQSVQDGYSWADYGKKLLQNYQRILA